MATSQRPAPAADQSTFAGVFLGMGALLALFVLFTTRDSVGFYAFAKAKHTLLPCKTPITYSIDEFDERFGITEEEFLLAVQDAETLWESAVDRNLFAYKPVSELRISLVYDYRQAGTERLQALNENIANNQTSYTSLKTEYDVVYTKYLEQKGELDSLLKDHQQRSADYEARVAEVNAKGGATQREHRRLEEERQSLNTSAAAINAKVEEINTTATEVNTLAEALNGLAETLNLTADTYATIGDQLGDEFIEGTFGAGVDGYTIDIYQFEDKEKLTRVLAHELGHALGLEHVDDPEAIMYRLNEGENDELTPADISALQKECRIDS